MKKCLEKCLEKYGAILISAISLIVLFVINISNSHLMQQLISKVFLRDTISLMITNIVVLVGFVLMMLTILLQLGNNRIMEMIKNNPIVYNLLINYCKYVVYSAFLLVTLLAITLIIGVGILPYYLLYFIIALNIYFILSLLRFIYYFFCIIKHKNIEEEEN